jgi:hypothetical protein
MRRVYYLALALSALLWADQQGQYVKPGLAHAVIERGQIMDNRWGVQGMYWRCGPDRAWRCQAGWSGSTAILRIPAPKP